MCSDKHTDLQFLFFLLITIIGVEVRVILMIRILSCHKWHFIYLSLFCVKCRPIRLLTSDNIDY